MDDLHFSQLLDRLGMSWKGYRKVRKGVKKRISRHMHHLGCRTMEAYLRYIDEAPEHLRAVEQLLTVSISHFFRDHRLWRTLEEKIIPRIIEQNPTAVEVWSAGCALGQEAYSVAMMWSRFSRNIEPLPALHLWATDMNPDYLQKAMDGTYRKGALKGIPDEIKSSFFHPSEDGSGHTINAVVKHAIIWQAYDLIRDPAPSSKFHLIFLRNNLLTYYRPEIIAPSFRKVVDCLADGGFIIIGSHEKLPAGSHDLVFFDGSTYIFQKIRISRYRA